MIYREIGLDTDGQMIYGRYDDDGLCRLTCVADYQEFKDWLLQNNKKLASDGSIVDNKVK